MSKSIIAGVAFCALLVTAAPAFAQDAPCPAKGFEGPHGSATNLRDTPTSDPTAARGSGFDGPHGSASNLRDAPTSDPTAGRGNGFDGPHGSASNLRDAPTSDPTAGRGNGFGGMNGSATNLRDTPRKDDALIAPLPVPQRVRDGAHTRPASLTKAGKGQLVLAGGATSACN